MLIPCIFICAIFILLLLGSVLFIHFTKVDLSKYEISITPTKFERTMSLILPGIGLLMTILAAVFSIMNKENQVPIVFSASGVLLGFVGLGNFIILANTFVAINGKYIFFRSFVGVRRISVNDVFAIDYIRRFEAIAKDKYGKSLFKVNTSIENGLKIVNLIKERKEQRLFESDEVGTDSSLENREDRNEILIKIGKYYRDNFPLFFKKTILAFCVGASITDATLIALLIYCVLIFKEIPAIIIFGLVFFSVVELVVTISIVTRLKNELKNDDEWLGAKHISSCKYVVGYHKNKAKKISFLLASLLVFGVISAPILISTYQEDPVAKSSLIEISGKIDYVYRNSDGYYVLSFINDNTEYRSPDYNSKYVDYSLFNHISSGTIVYITSDNKNPSLIKNNSRGRDQFKQFYTIKTDSEELVSYESYYMSAKDNQKVGIVVGYVCLGLGVVGMMAIIIVNLTIRNKNNEEYIQI